MGKFFDQKWFKLFIVVLAFNVAFGSYSIVFAAQSDDPSQLTFPIENHTVLKKFVAPTTPFSAGHRGVDFLAPLGTSVYSVGAGTVIFAGNVAGSLHVTILHGKDIKSTYTYLATKTVRVGDEVRKGQLIGSTGGTHLTGVVNSFLFTLRIANQYVDPLIYLSGAMTPREIHLGDISKPSKSLLQRYLEFEKIQITSLVKAVDALTSFGSDVNEEFNRFAEWFIEEGIKNVKKAGEVLADAYEKTATTLRQVKDLAEKIAKDAANGLKNKVEQGLIKLKKLEERAMRFIKEAFKETLQLSRKIAKYFSAALGYGVDAAKWFLRTIGDLASLPSRISNDLVLGIIDLFKSAGTSSLKLLHQYFEIDLPTLLRAIVAPGTCLVWTCSQAVELKCDPRASFTPRTTTDGYQGSGNEVMVISGINTKGKVNKKTGEMEQTVDIPVDDLGYEKNDVTYFSYAGEGKDFNSKTTYQDLRTSAKNMDDQIIEWKRGNPGKKLDVITHSMGGAVTSMWLAEFYNPGDDAYPELGKVVMLAPPLSGTALATAGQIIDTKDDGNTFHSLLAEWKDGVPAPDDRSFQQMVENGDLENTIEKKGVMKKVEVTAIRLPSDNVVTAASESTDGVDEIILNNWTPGPNPIDAWDKLAMAHFDIKTNKKVVATVQHILEGTKPPCESTNDALSSIAQASVVHAAEVTLGRGIRDVSDASATADVNRFVDSLSGS